MELMVRANAEGGGVESYFFLHPIVKRIPVGNPQLKQNVGNAFSTATEVMHTEGLAGFWRGNLVNILRTAPFKAINFMSFDLYHKLWKNLTGEDGNTARFAAGACAGGVHAHACDRIVQRLHT